MLYLHLVQHGQVVAVPRELWPQEGPERCVLDLMMVVELLIQVAPGRGHAPTAAAALNRCRSRRNASWIR